MPPKAPYMRQTEAPDSTLTRTDAWEEEHYARIDIFNGRYIIFDTSGRRPVSSLSLRTLNDSQILPRILQYVKVSKEGAAMKLDIDGDSIRQGDIVQFAGGKYVYVNAEWISENAPESSALLPYGVWIDLANPQLPFAGTSDVIAWQRSIHESQNDRPKQPKLWTES